MLYPYRFQPILVERIWGGQTLARYGKALPPGKFIGETWEISDRDDAQSIVINGPHAGQTLRHLITHLGADIVIGRARPPGAPRFPLLVKLLDARQRLSLQVHPPAAVAPELGGEPKTEMWYVLDADPDAKLVAGLRRGVTRQQFEDALRTHAPTLHDLFHQLPVHTGDSLFVPSGRLHAIGSGLVIAEIQQSSDTTYRVYDWDRRGADGKPRQLHIRESLASIDFNDFEPKLTPLPIRCDYFHVEKLTVTGTLAGRCDGTTFHILACVAGNATVGGERLQVGEFALLPAALGDYTVTGQGDLLRATLPTR